ncbi:MAG: hypothetical protein ABW166_13350 [Sedimenticola sp.]
MRHSISKTHPPNPAYTGARQPQRTAAYQAVQHHLESWLAQQREARPDDDSIPQYVERDLRKFLECGILAYGFAYMDVGT